MNAFSGPGLSVSLRSEHACVIAALSGELDITCAPALREQLLGLLRPGAGRLVVDLSRVSYADASGLAVLVGTGRRAGLLGAFLRLAAPAPAVARVLRVAGLHRQLAVFRTVQAKLTSPGRGQRPTDGTADAYMDAAGSTVHTEPAPRKTRRARRPADAGELRPAIAAVLMHADAWRDADPTASSLPPCTPWPAPMPAPATPLWPRRRSPSCPSSPVSPSPTPRRSQLPPAVFAAFSTPIGGPHSPETTHRATAWSGSSPPVSALTVNGKSGREGRARDHLRRSDHLTGISKRPA